MVNARKYARTQLVGSTSVWVGDLHILCPGIHPNPSESDPLSNPSESGIHICRAKMPIQTVK